MYDGNAITSIANCACSVVVHCACSVVVQLAAKETMSAALLTVMSAMPAMSDSSSLEIEPDAGPADPPHTADAMAEGDSADAVAKVALAPVSLHFGGKSLSQYVQ